MRLKTGPAWIVGALLAAVALAGCTLNVPTEGQLTLTATGTQDGQRFESLFVTFSEVRLHVAGEGTPDVTAPDNDTAGVVFTEEDRSQFEGEDWIVVVQQTTEIDLVSTTTEDAKALVDAADIEAGQFDQIVIFVEDARAVATDGSTEVDIRVENAVVIIRNLITITEDEATKVIIEFDLDESLQPADDVGGPANGTGNVTVNVFVLSLAVVNVIIEEDTDKGRDRDRDPPFLGGDEGEINLFVRSAEFTTAELDAVIIVVDRICVKQAGGDDEEDNATISPTPTEPSPTTNETNTTSPTANATNTTAPAPTNTTAGNETGEDPFGGNCVDIEVDGEIEINLLNFTGTDARAFLALEDVESGKFTQIRLNVVDAFVVQDGQEIEVEVPNPVSKIIQPFEINEDETTLIVIEIDLQSSLHQTPEGWRLTPVIGKVVVEEDADGGEDDVTPSPTATTPTASPTATNTTASPTP